jgi:hypothetical protein
VAFELKTPPTVTVTLIAESASASLPIVTASWAPERKPRPLYESNNQNNFSLEEEEEEEAANNIQLESLMIFYD